MLALAVVGVAAGQAVASTPADCAGAGTEAERAACAAQEPAAVQAAHRKVFEACAAKLSDFLRQRLVAQEEAWQRDLRLECSEADGPCLARSTRRREAAMRAEFPQCGGSQEPQPLVEAGERAKTGMLPARWTRKDGHAEEVPFSFESQSESAGTMSTTLGRGGEHFRGDYVRVEKSTKGHLVTAVYDGWSSPEWEVWDHDAEGHWKAAGVSFGEFARFYTGKVLATLRGSEGNSMRCQLTLRQPQSGLLGGGSGACQVSDGGSLLLEF